MAPQASQAPSATVASPGSPGTTPIKPTAEPELDPEHPHLSQVPIKPLVYAAGCVAAFGGLIFGYDIGGSGGTFNMVGFRDQFGWPRKVNSTDEDSKHIADEQGWITSVFALGAAAGALPSGYLTDKIGRKWTLFLYAFIFCIGALIQMLAADIGTLYAGRFVGGIAVGGLSMVTTMYQSELAPEAIRGQLVALQQLSITFGILLAAALNVGLQHWTEGWRLSYGGNGFIAFALCCLVPFFPESPRWLVKRGQIEEARRQLNRLRFPHEVEPELQLIIADEAAQAKLQEGSWLDLFRPNRNMYYITWVGVAVLFLQQLTGINAIMYFAPVIFSTFMSSDNALYANLGIMGVNFLSTFIAIALVDRKGRRSLLTYGSFGMAAMSVVVTLLSGLGAYKTSTAVGALIIVFSALYVINFAYSWGPVGWIVPAEIFPNDLRDKGMTLTTTGNWLSNFAIGKLTPIFIRRNVFNLWGTFLFFGCWCLIMGFFTLVFVPETKGVALEDVDGLFTDFRKAPLAKRLVNPNMSSGKAFAHTTTKQRDRQGTELTPLPPV